ncbi:MAG: GntR family transcriptional regulator [Desulfobacteraceae bacterium]|nr:GntR family transcriptional regulator [Desulfobacteraceae bacterium]
MILNALKNVPSSLSEQVYQKLRTEIVRGEIASGDRLIESAVAEQMGVSRTPAREALNRLTTEGFLVAIPRAGYLVADMSENDIRDLFKTRLAVEEITAKWAFENITKEELAQLERNLVRSNKVLADGEPDKMMNLDTEFHHIIYAASRSKSMYQINQTLSDRTLKFRISCMQDAEIARRARDDHFGIYQALQSGDIHQVEETVRKHLGNVVEDIIDHFEKLRHESYINREREY